MNKFTPDELHRAIIALNTIERDGDREEWSLILRQAQDSARNGSRWGNATSNQKIGGILLADRLAGLLGAPTDDCEQAAADVFATQRHRVIFDALIGYADELSGKAALCEQVSSDSQSMAPRSAVRIVPGKAGDA